MKIIEIDLKVKIFDDAEYCEDEDTNCLFDSINMVDTRPWCILFGEYVDDSDELHGKCSECKKAHQKAKS